MPWAITSNDIPEQLCNLHRPPRQLFIDSIASDCFSQVLRRKRVAIVGTRRVSAYGQTITAQLASDLAARGVVIVSGLAFGVDAIAHRAALDAGGLTMAVLPSPVETIYPRSHHALARRIVDSGGLLVSEYPEGSALYKSNFIDRNRLVTGLADALLITEASENSGTLHTAQFALEQGVELMVVPGNITSPTSIGTNSLLKVGAHPITCLDDMLSLLKLMPSSADGLYHHRVVGANNDEQNIINLLEQGITSGSELLSTSGLSVDTFNHHLTMLEITAKVRPLGANRWALA